MLIKEIFKSFNEIIPTENAAEWDNSGEQIQFSNEVVNSVLTTLEVTDEVINEAISKDCNLILSHHPLLFSKVNVISDDDPKARMLIKLISNKISVFSAHTNYDVANGGTSDYLAKQLGLKDVSTIEGSEGFAMTGYLQERMSLEEFIKMACESTGTPLNEVRFTGVRGNLVHKIGLCAGSGSDFILNAFNADCDVFLTGDVKYHSAQDSLELGMAVVDMGHYHTEKFFAVEAAKIYGDRINSRMNTSIEFIPSKVDVNPFFML